MIADPNTVPDPRTMTGGGEEMAVSDPDVLSKQEGDSTDQTWLYIDCTTDNACFATVFVSDEGDLQSQYTKASGCPSYKERILT